MSSNVEHPKHYNMGNIEVIDAIEAWGFGEGFNRGNGIKYTARAGHKDPETEIEDLEKAKWYIEREIERVKKKKELAEKGDHSPTTSQSERDILDGCIDLMHQLTGRFQEYLEFVGFEPDGDDMIFGTRFTYFEIVQRLFLWNTSHSGGTSTGNKCRELGVDSSKGITFDCRAEDDEDEEDG